MTLLVALDTLWHRQVHIDEKKVEETAADLHLIPLVVSEFTQALAQFPILFSKTLKQGSSLVWPNRHMLNLRPTPLNVACVGSIKCSRTWSSDCEPKS
jgi:hypothetical protein